MSSYVVRRFMLVIPVAWLVSFMAFSLVRFLPGDITLEMLQGSTDTVAAARLRAQLGLDQPFHVQYVHWLGNVLRGDLGVSLRDGRPVIGEILKTLPVTIELAILAGIISVVVAVPLGAIAAVRQDKLPDYFARLLAILWLSIPSFWLATLFLVGGARYLKWAPPLRYTPFLENPTVNLQQFFFPAVCLAAYSAAAMMRLTRSTLLEVLRQDYVRTAAAKGLSERVIVIRHALKNALIPVVTIMGIQLAFLLGGAVIIESVFSLPGLGLLTVTSIRSRDYPQIQGNVLMIAMAVVLVNLAVDLIYGLLDPRIRFEK